MSRVHGLDGLPGSIDICPSLYDSFHPSASTSGPWLKAFSFSGNIFFRQKIQLILHSFSIISTNSSQKPAGVECLQICLELRQLFGLHFFLSSPYLLWPFFPAFYFSLSSCLVGLEPGSGLVVDFVHGTVCWVNIKNETPVDIFGK